MEEGWGICDSPLNSMNQTQQTGAVAALTSAAVAMTEVVMNSPEEVKAVATVPMVAIPLVVAVIIGQQLNK